MFPVEKIENRDFECSRDFVHFRGNPPRIWAELQILTPVRVIFGVLGVIPPTPGVDVHSYYSDQ